VPKPLSLSFDPIARADELWTRRWGSVPSMVAITSIMRAQQILLAQVDAVVKPYGLTFARYEALVLLTFSQHGELPLSKIGERLMVHPTSVTNTVDRLEKSGLRPQRLRRGGLSRPVRRAAPAADRGRGLHPLRGGRRRGDGGRGRRRVRAHRGGASDPYLGGYALFPAVPEPGCTA